MRTAEIIRNTAETQITLSINLDGNGTGVIDTGVGFLNHMLTLFSKHGRIDLSVTCKGDTEVDDHHSVEDIGIALGQALKSALGDKRGICRYGDILLPMDEALILCAVDLSGRGVLRMKYQFSSEKIGTFDTELVQEFFLALVRESGMTLHFQQLDGENAHHIAEGMFKAFGHALRKAVQKDERGAGEIPSTKGVLS